MDPAAFAKSVHGKNKCTSCHKGFGLSIPQHQVDPNKDYKEVAIESCEGCHSKEFMQLPDVGPRQEVLRRQGRAHLHLLSRVARHQAGAAGRGDRRVQDEHGSRTPAAAATRTSSRRPSTSSTSRPCRSAMPGPPPASIATAPTRTFRSSPEQDETVQQCRQCHPGATKGFTFFQMHLDENFQNAWWGVRVVYLFFSTLLLVVLVIGIAYTTIHFQKEMRTMLGVAGRGMGRLFGFIRALEEESVRDKISDDVNGPTRGQDDGPEADDRGSVADGRVGARPWCRRNPGARAGRDYYVRFYSYLRLSHFIMMTTFIGCALTGPPLKYSYDFWAQTHDGLLGRRAERRPHPPHHGRFHDGRLLGLLASTWRYWS